MDQVEFFNERAERWDELCVHDPARLERLLDLAGPGPGMRVLDVGCGTGVLAPQLAARVGATGTVIAIDIAERMVEVARRKHAGSNVSFVHGDVLAAGWDDGRPYDAVICYSMFPHFADKAAALARLATRLAPGGLLAVLHSQGRDALNALHRGAGAAVAGDRLPPAADVAGLCAAAGLVVRAVVDEPDLYAVVAARSRSADPR